MQRILDNCIKFVALIASKIIANAIYKRVFKFFIKSDAIKKNSDNEKIFSRGKHCHCFYIWQLLKNPTEKWNYLKGKMF
jgi:hypothetical protein